MTAHALSGTTEAAWLEGREPAGTSLFLPSYSASRLLWPSLIIHNMHANQFVDKL